MKNIFVVYPGRANYPEVAAYRDYFQTRGVDVLAGSVKDYQALPNKSDFVLWSIMGFYPKRFESDFVVHDYRSLSVGSWSTMKDFAKRYLNCTPDLRIFQNVRQREIMRFSDNVPHVILPMGVPNWIFEVDPTAAEAPKGADFCYIGEMSLERGFDRIIDAFLERFRHTDVSFLLVGRPDERILQRYQHEQQIVFTGPKPQREALTLVAQSDIAVCYFPYHRPHCYQTPTKLLEYAALGKKIVCNDSPSNIACCAELDINSVITGANIFGSLAQDQILTARSNMRSRFANLRWANVIEQSNVTRYLPRELNVA